MKCKTKSVIVDAILYTGDNKREIIEFTENKAKTNTCYSHLTIYAPEGGLTVDVNDWVINDNGKFSVCTPDVFALKYEHPDNVDGDEREYVYLAYIMYLLSDFKCLVYSSKSLEWDIKKKAPMSYDARQLFMDVLKKIKPELYDPHKTVNEIVVGVEMYLFNKTRTLEKS